jgi:hypothetical protein
MIAKVLQASLVFLLILCMAAIVGCEGEVGPEGPIGPQGETGEDGQDGQDGQDGNANVIMFEFGSRTSSDGAINYLFEATQAQVDVSLVLGYYNVSSFKETVWYPVPGLGEAGDYITRSYWFQSEVSPGDYVYWVEFENPDGSGQYTLNVTLDKFRIILVPASTFMKVTASGSLDLNDYHSVKEYFGLPE